MGSHKFKLGMFLTEPQLPFEEALDLAAELGVKYLWYMCNGQVSGRPEDKALVEMSEAEIDAMQAKLTSRGQEFFLLLNRPHFKGIHLTDFELDNMEEHPIFKRDFDELVRTMEIAAYLGVPAVNVFSFLWPGELAGKQTWPMRWMTRGGIISDLDMDKLVKAFSLIMEQGERHNVDVAVSMMCWNYTNTTGNFRRVAERVGSPRMKVMWGPADNTNCGESDTATAGFQNVRPYLYGLHIKDLRVNDGLSLDFEYCPLGEGDTDYPTVFRNLRDHDCDVFLSLSTHFQPPGGTNVDAMRINAANIKKLLDQVEGETA